MKKIEYTAKERIAGKWQDSGYISIWGGTGYIRNNIIYFNFNADFYETLSKCTAMPYMKDKLKINTKLYPHAYYFSRWIDLNYRMNEGKPRVNTITVKTMLEKAPLLPSYAEISRTTRQYYKRIIKPFIENLDAIEHLYYDFIDEDNEVINDPAEEFKGAGGYNRFISSKLRIDYNDYPKHTKRLAARAKHKRDLEAATTKAKAKYAAKSNTK